MIVQVFLAEGGAGAFERTFKPESEFRFAGRIELDDEHDDAVFAAEVVFAICNSYPPDEMHGPEQYHDQVVAYRRAGNRSLSVGDVVAIGEAFYFCASGSWELVTAPSANLIAAFMSANEFIVKES